MMLMRFTRLTLGLESFNLVNKEKEIFCLQ